METTRGRLKNTETEFTRPDKGVGIIILNRKEDINKNITLLIEKSRFTKYEGETDKTPTIVNSMCKPVRRPKQDGIISSTNFEKNPASCSKNTAALRPTKDRIPFRPRPYMSDSPYHDRAEWRAEVIEPNKKWVVRFDHRDTFKCEDLIG